MDVRWSFAALGAPVRLGWSIWGAKRRFMQLVADGRLGKVISGFNDVALAAFLDAFGLGHSQCSAAAGNARRPPAPRVRAPVEIDVAVVAFTFAQASPSTPVAGSRLGNGGAIDRARRFLDVLFARSFIEALLARPAETDHAFVVDLSKIVVGLVSLARLARRHLGELAHRLLRSFARTFIYGRQYSSAWRRSWCTRSASRDGGRV
eukprot:362795-Chlamydomonas_euryale.AAC.8